MDSAAKYMAVLNQEVDDLIGLRRRLEQAVDRDANPERHTEAFNDQLRRVVESSALLTATLRRRAVVRSN